MRWTSRSHYLFTLASSSYAFCSVRLATSVRRGISTSFAARAASFSAMYYRACCSIALACCSTALARWPNASFSAAICSNFPAASSLYLKFSDSVSCNRRVRCSSWFGGGAGLTGYALAYPIDDLMGWLGVVVGVLSPSYLPLLRVIPC